MSTGSASASPTAPSWPPSAPAWARASTRPSTRWAASSPTCGPSILDHQGLWAALEWQAQEFVENAELRSDVKVHVAAGVDAPGGVAGQRWSIAVFRIFQEMLSNVARHARAGAVEIRMYVDSPPDPVLYLEVRDDGVGASAEAIGHPGSYGVLGMRERAGHFGGGRIAIDSVPGGGTRVSLAMPFPPEPAP